MLLLQALAEVLFDQFECRRFGFADIFELNHMPAELGLQRFGGEFAFLQLDQRIAERFHYSRDGTYTDCYTTDIAGTITQAEYVAAFYTTSVFKLERLILKYAVSMPSTDDQARQLAAGALDTIAAGHVEARSENQLLMCDFQRRTRSWLMVAPLASESGSRTRLYFGSAVVPVKNSSTGQLSLGPVFHALLGFHRIYSRLLLLSAKARLQK